ncbi:MAG: cytochrome c biogenesis protein CcdA [Gemmatimonadota bacterium]
MLLDVLVQGGLGEALHRPLVAIPTLFGAGVLTSLTPCLYPMIPITVAVIGGTGAAGHVSRRRTVGLTLTYVAGLALLYALLGLVAGLTGSLFGTISSSPWARFAIGNLLLLFGLAMLSTTQSAVLGFIYLFAFSIGMTALLVVVGLFSGALAVLPRSGPWLVVVKKAAGVLMIAVAEYYFIQMGMVM